MTKKTLLFDLTAFQPSQGKFHGAGEYAKSVLLELIKNKVLFDGVFIPNKWIDETIVSMLKKHNCKMLPINNNKDLQKIINTKYYSTFFSALGYDYYNIDFSNTKYKFVLHGLRDLEMPCDKYEFFCKTNLSILIKYLIKFFFPKYYKNRIFSKFKKLIKINNSEIIVPSLHTKYSVLSFFNWINPKSIKVFYSPEKIVLQKTISSSFLKTKGLEPKKFFLLINANRWIKNPIRAIKEMDLLYSQHDIKYKTAILGGKSLNKFLLQLKNPNSFIFLDYVSDGELETLYKNAYLFLYPTLNEGFGYPPLEAMKYSTPTICSSVSSVSEIYQNSVLYINPFIPSEISNRILLLLNEKSIYKEYCIKAKKQYDIISKKQKLMLNNLVKTITD